LVLLLPLFPSSLLPLLPSSTARGEEIPEKYRPVVNAGLEGLATTQFQDGPWEGNGRKFASAMTGIAGTTLLMQGSTIREGKYKDNIRRAVDWLTDRTQRNGLIGDPLAPNQGLGYLYGHGF